MVILNVVFLAKHTVRFGLFSRRTVMPRGPNRLRRDKRRLVIMMILVFEANSNDNSN
jgi:hypothetical protein